MSSKTNKKEPAGSFSLKQLMHNDTERKRKKRMIEMVDKIVDLLPMKCVGKTSRISRLEQLYSYVLELRNKNDGLMFANPNSVQAQEISQLKRYIEHLENTNKNYLKLLKLAGISAASAVEMGDRNWSKPLKYSNKVFLENDKSATKMKDLVKGKKSKNSNDNDNDESSDDSSESSESEKKSPVRRETIQVLNTLPVQQPQVQYVLLSTGSNAPAQLVPMICSVPVLSNSHQNVFLSNNITTAPSTSQISLAKDNSINTKIINTNKSIKSKKKNEKKNVSFVTNEKPPERSSKTSSSLTTTIERCAEDDSEDRLNCNAVEPSESVLENSKSGENKEQDGKRSSVSEEQVIEANKKAKTSDSGQQPNNASTSASSQQSVNSNSNLEKSECLSATRSTMSPSTSTAIYQVNDDSNDSQRATLTNTAQSVAGKPAPTNSTLNRCNYSTESLLQPQGETSQTSSNQLNSSESRSNLNQQQSQADHTLTYNQQQPSVPSFTVKDSLMSSSNPVITSSSNSITDKHNFDLNSSVSSLCSKRNQPFENIEALGVSSSATTPNLFDPSISVQSDSQQLMSSLVISSWSHEPSAASHSSASSANAFSGSQSYSNANSVLFANQVPASFSLLSTTPTSFETSVPNAVFSSSSHKSLSSNPSSAFNFIPELNSIGSYSLANLDDQSNSNQQNGSSIVDNYPRSSVSATAAASSASRAASNVSRSSSSTTANTTVSSASASSTYSKQKSTTSAKASSSSNSTPASNTRSAKSSAASSKKSTTKSTSSTVTDPKFSQAVTSMSASTASASANVFSRSHHHHHHHHHSQPTHPSHRPLTNDAGTSFPPFPTIISDPMTFLSVTSVAAGHSSSVMSTTTASSAAPPSFPSHAHHHHPSHQPFSHSSYSNFFTSSQPSEQLPPSYDNRSYEAAAPSANDPSQSSSNADLSDHNQLVNYPIFRPQPQPSHTFVMPSTSSGGTSGTYQPSASSSSSSAHSRHNFSNPTMYPHHQSSSSHITNFNIGCLLPDSTLSSPGAYASTSEFISSKSAATHSASKSSHTSSSTSSMAASSAPPPVVSNTGLPKIAQLAAKSLPQAVAPIVVDPFASSVPYQNTAPSSASHSHQYHPTPHPAFYPHAHPPPPTPPSQTTVTYSSSHPLNPSHFTSSSSAVASQSRNAVRNNASFTAADEVDGSGNQAVSSGSTRSSSLSGQSYYYHPHSEMFNPSLGSAHQSSAHHNQPLGTHHLRQQHHHFPPPPNAASTHNFNQSASAVPVSVANFNLQSSINTSTAGPTPHRLLSLNF